MTNAVATNAVAKRETDSGSGVVTRQREQVKKLDLALQELRGELSDPDMGELTRALVQADAVRFLENALTDEMMTSVMQLMNNPLGFKTDRPTKENPNLYPVQTVKRCLIVALLVGAKPTGNEFNIIAGNCYLTKGFTRPTILRWPGLRSFEIQIGAPVKFGEKTAACEAWASWKIKDQYYELKCVKSSDMDARIIVNCFSSSSPDEIRGKAEAKLYQRVLARLTGINLDDSENGDSDSGSPVVQGSIAEQQTPAQESAKLVTEADDGEASRMICDQAKATFAELDSVNEVQKFRDDRVKLVLASGWSEELKDQTTDCLRQYADDRIAEIRANRGGK